MIRKAYNIADLRELARKRLPKGLFEFIDRGTEDEVALRHNRESFDRIKFAPERSADPAEELGEAWTAWEPAMTALVARVRAGPRARPRAETRRARPD